MTGFLSFFQKLHPYLISFVLLRVLGGLWLFCHRNAMPINFGENRIAAVAQ
jgi:hypothetical protein